MYILQENWEKTEDKPAAVLITLSAVLALITLNGVVDAVDKIPIVSGVIELVGIVVTGAFTYRYLVFGPDRWDTAVRTHGGISVFLATGLSQSKASCCLLIPVLFQGRDPMMLPLVE